MREEVKCQDKVKKEEKHVGIHCSTQANGIAERTTRKLLEVLFWICDISGSKWSRKLQIPKKISLVILGRSTHFLPVFDYLIDLEGSQYLHPYLCFCNVSVWVVLVYPRLKEKTKNIGVSILLSDPTGNGTFKVPTLSKSKE